MDIKGKQCLVVGAGPVGVRKARNLAKCGARVVMVSPEDQICVNLKGQNNISYFSKGYDPSDLEGMALVFAATDNAELNRKIKTDARRLNIWCNLADAPDSSDFILPSIVHKGDLILAVSTSGASPALAKKIRLELEERFGSEYEKILKVMGNIRKQLLKGGHAPDEHKKIFYSLIDQGLLDLIKAEDEPAINRILTDLLGKDYEYRQLVS